MEALREHPAPRGGYDANRADLGAALAKGNASRNDYYRRRLAGLGSPQHRVWDVRAARGFRDSTSLSLSELGKLLTLEEDGHPVDAAQRDAFVGAGLHSGLLACDAFGQLSMPIPSFRDFLNESEAA